MALEPSHLKGACIRVILVARRGSAPFGQRPFHSGASADAPASSERQYLLSYGQGRPYIIIFFLWCRNRGRRSP